MATKSSDAAPIDIAPTDVESRQFCIIGLTPFIHNRMAEKARHELLYPKGRKNAAERAASIKHDPVEEFRASPYRAPNDSLPTELAVMGSMFKGAMMTAALDLPGSSKAQVGRLIIVEEHYLPFWGDAKLHMAVTRSADAARTPDIRTRAISPEWATIITVSFVRPLITATTVVNLLSTGGRSAGVGDWRPQKGKGSFGQYRICNEDDPDFQRILLLDKTVQVASLEAADPYDHEASELLEWYGAERKERGR